MFEKSERSIASVALTIKPKFNSLNVSKLPRSALQNPIQFYIREIRVTNRLGRPDNLIKIQKKKKKKKKNLHIFKRFKVTPQTPSQPVTPVGLTEFSVTKSTGCPGRPPPNIPHSKRSEQPFALIAKPQPQPHVQV